MLELLNASGTGGLFLRNSGPGTKILKYGDLDLGYFGEVTSSELFTTDELSHLLGLEAGIINESNPTWLKFAYQGKILYIAKTPLKTNISWDVLYHSGLVYGTDDDGPLNTLIEQSNVNQIRLVTKENRTLLVRLLRGDISDPSSTLVSTSTDTNYDREAEFDQLLYRVSIETISFMPGPSFGDGYRSDELGLNNITLLQEHNEESNYSTIWGRGLNNSIRRVTQVDKQLINSQYGWRPVLELLEEGILFSPLVRSYETSATLTNLADVTFNSKNTINPLTKLRGDIVEGVALVAPYLTEYDVSVFLIPERITTRADDNVGLMHNTQLGIQATGGLSRTAYMNYRSSTMDSPYILKIKGQSTLFPLTSIEAAVTENYEV